MKRRATVFVLALLLAVLPMTVFANDLPRLDEELAFVSVEQEPPHLVKTEGGMLLEPLAPGSTLYIPIQNAQRAEDLSDSRAMAEWMEGGELVQTLKLEYRLLYEADGETEIGYRFVLSVKFGQIPEGNEKQTISGRVALTRRMTHARELTLTLSPQGVQEMGNILFCRSESMVLQAQEESGHLGIAFGDSALFEVDLDGQGSLDVGFSQRPVGGIAAKYPKTKMRFLSWPKEPIFDQKGTLYLYAEPDEFLYEVRDGRVLSSDAVYSDQEGTFILTTRRLSAYVITDSELGAPDPEDFYNPPTGFSKK